MKNRIIIGCLGVLLLSLVAVGIYVYQDDRKRINEMESQLRTLREQEKKSVISQRVSKQMEEIAYGQQAVSEERRQEAIHQSEIAQEMRLRSETERQKAIEAQGIAEKSAQEARDAYQMAEHQRIEANEQRRQAEHAKLVADTLNYQSLGRTLGSQSYSIYQAGDTELGNMLAYASYYYTQKYDGDIFIPAVFQALTQSAGGRHSWNIHNGGITCVEFSAKDNHLLTVSTYGEIFIHKAENGQLHTTQLLNDQSYCFRDGYAAKNGKDYAISHTGHLVIADGKQTRTVYLEKTDRPFNLQNMNDGRQLLIVGENSIALLDVATDKIVGTRQLGFRVTCTGRRDYKPILFDNRGYMHLVNSLDDITNEKVPVPGRITAYATSNNDKLTAYGMADGTIWLTDSSNNTYKLVDHLSQVTKLKFNGRRLYSSSYDGKLLFWMTGGSQIKPITLIQAGSWLTDFTFSTDKDYVWTGEQRGIVTEYLISLPKIAQRLRQNVKRDFSQEEWNYYVGKGIPYTSFGLNNK